MFKRLLDHQRTRRRNKPFGHPAALHEFETSLEQTPNRYRTFLGIARAANAAGDRQKASEYYGKLVNLAKNADTERPETQEAKAFLAGKQ